MPQLVTRTDRKQDLAVQREHLGDAMVALERAVAAAGPARASAWAGEVLGALEGLEQAFTRHLSFTEDPGALFDEVMAAAPRLSHAIERLRADHTEIAEAIATTSAALRQAPSGNTAEWVDQQRGACLELLGSLARHRQRGADLTYEAFVTDLGGTD
ncbi:MAG: hypothetical protein OEY23_23570 [Acidimicrobiia bacterium]|nr:hypothetical protein [Acidimicrobiia bacterium]